MAPSETMEVKAVLAQHRVDAKTNEHRAAPELLGVLPIKGKVVTGDAMFTHRDVCAAVIDGGGDYVLPVKENQPTLARDIAAALAEPEADTGFRALRWSGGPKPVGRRETDGSVPQDVISRSAPGPSSPGAIGFRPGRNPAPSAAIGRPQREVISARGHDGGGEHRREVPRGSGLRR